MSTPEDEDLTEEDVAELDRDGDVHEDGDGDDDPAGAAPAEPQDDEPSSLANVEAIGKKLDLLSKHVAKRMGEILGDDANEFEECEVCTFWGTPGWRHKGPLPSAVEDVLKVALGGHASAEYRPDEYSRECDRCNGLGVVLTGSKVLGQETLQCMKCHGMGWQPIGNERATGAFAYQNGPAAAPPPVLTPAAAAPPESPEIAAAKALLTGAGWMAFPPIVTAA